MHKSLFDLKVTWKIFARLNCFQKVHTRHSQTTLQLVFIVIQAGESSFNLSIALR